MVQFNQKYMNQGTHIPTLQIFCIHYISQVMFFVFIMLITFFRRIVKKLRKYTYTYTRSSKQNFIFKIPFSTTYFSCLKFQKISWRCNELIKTKWYWSGRMNLKCTESTIDWLLKGLTNSVTIYIKHSKYWHTEFSI